MQIPITKPPKMAKAIAAMRPPTPDRPKIALRDLLAFAGATADSAELPRVGSRATMRRAYPLLRANLRQSLSSVPMTRCLRAL